MRLLSLFCVLIFSACSLFKVGGGSKKSEAIELNGFAPMSKKDYRDHLAAFERSYLGTPGVELFNLRSGESNYLRAIASEIIKNNELFFTKEALPSIKVVKNETPFHFSLPGRRIFLSSGLIGKYIKSEKLLYSVLAYELIRSEKNIYRKARIVPTGYMPTSRILSLLRLDTGEKVETHKWAYYTLKRVGIDTDIYLSWLQIQNRNSVDFSLQLGDTSSISREESLFKAFIVENAAKKSSLSKYERSSKDFYAFVNRIKR